MGKIRVRTKKVHPRVGMDVMWASETGKPEIDNEIKVLAGLYGRSGMRIFHVSRKGRWGHQVSLTKHGSIMVHEGTKNIRSFDWELLRQR